MQEKKKEDYFYLLRCFQKLGIANHILLLFSVMNREGNNHLTIITIISLDFFQ